MAKAVWKFETHEINSINKIVNKPPNEKFVESRRRNNIEPKSIEITQPKFWGALMASLMTSQQASGPEDDVTQFVIHDIDQIGLQKCRGVSDVELHVAQTLQDYGGIRYYNNIGKYAAINLQRLEDDDGWPELWNRLHPLIENRERKPQWSDKKSERDVAEYLHTGLSGEGLHGLGPKQSKNLLQILGLTRFETPLDSRIIGWLNENMDLPVEISVTDLNVVGYYKFVMDIVQDGCKEAGVYPCIFDAAVFSSYDTEWSEDAANAIF